ncbi:MAG: discoidin domain-containing protein [Polyangiales bacterium]
MIPTSMASALDRARSFFGVAGARVRLDDASRSKLVHELALARQKREAASHLARQGSRAEALALVAVAFSRARSAAEGTTLGEPLRQRADQVERRLASNKLPELDEAFGSEHATLLEDALDVTHRIEGELADATLTESAAKTLRIVRPVTAAVILVALAMATYFLVRTPPFRVEASASSEPVLPADRVIDGDLTTEWGLPDNQAGWIDIIPARRRFVQRVRLLNSKNIPGVERGTKAFRVEAIADGKVIKGVDGAFTGFTRDGQWQTVEIGEPGVQRIRITVKSWFGVAGGLTEVVVE